MSYSQAEAVLLEAIGLFSTVAHPVSGSNTRVFDFINYKSNNFTNTYPTQCQAFLTSSDEFILWIEQWDVVSASANRPVGTPPILLESKKVYPTRITGLGLPLINNNLFLSLPSVTMMWRDGLIRRGNTNDYTSDNYESGNYRPGFGQLIISDLQRPLQYSTIQPNNLGLPNNKFNSNSEQNPFTGPLGRLMSMAWYVNPVKAAQYDASKKKKQSLNPQDYEQIPIYPAYDIPVSSY